MSQLRTCFVLPLVSVLCGLVLMPTMAAAESAPNCAAPAAADRLDHPLTRVGQRLAAGQPITIVAVGSSSTAGAGATSSAASYPSRLEAELRERFPHVDIRVLNRGVNGEEAADMLARFDKTVIAERPDLVLWQVGTNTVLRDHSLTNTPSLIQDGLARLKATGADVILIDPQFAPKVIAKAECQPMLGLIDAAAKTANVAVFHRFAIMRHWREVERISFEAFLSPDGLHMNDWSYGCWAKLLASAIAEAATRNSTFAGAPPATAPAAPNP